MDEWNINFYNLFTLLYESFFISFLLWPHLTTHCSCRGLLITFSDTNTFGRTPLDEGSARRRHLYSHNIKHSHGTDMHANGGIRTRDPGKRAVTAISHISTRDWVLPGKHEAYGGRLLQITKLHGVISQKTTVSVFRPLDSHSPYQVFLVVIKQG